MHTILTMVKFFTQTCPMCLAGKDCAVNPSKCLCVVKGHMVPSRGYVKESDDKDPPKDTDPSKESTSAAENTAKTEEERFFTEIAKRYLEDLKKQEDLKKKSDDKED